MALGREKVPHPCLKITFLPLTSTERKWGGGVLSLQYSRSAIMLKSFLQMFELAYCNHFWGMGGITNIKQARNTKQLQKSPKIK